MKKIFVLLGIIITVFCILSFKTTDTRQGVIPPLKLDEKAYSKDGYNNIKIYHENVNSVVHITTVQRAENFFGQIIESSGSGSGFVWNLAGYIVTNSHVVAGSDKLVVKFYKDNKAYKAKVVGLAPEYDIAVLKLVDMPKVLYPIKIRKRTTYVGQKAIALGAPYDLPHTITTGIVSALGRTLMSKNNIAILDVIQTDASINPGNSGGPLLDYQGYLLGINTAIVSASGGSTGVGFAIPKESVAEVVPQLIKHGKLRHIDLGIRAWWPRNVDTEGIMIYKLDRDSILSKAGLRGIFRKNNSLYEGDLISAINGKIIRNHSDYFHATKDLKKGDSIKVDYIRAGKKFSKTIQL